jgi:hypothetical protein
MSQPNFIDLDTVSPAMVEIGLDGKTHAMKQLSLKDFIENMRILSDIEKRRADGKPVDPLEEIEIVAKMLVRSFPTISEERLMQLTLPQLTKLREIVEKASEASADSPALQEAAAAAGKDPKQGRKSPKSTSATSSPAS